jgi:DNA-binding NarL/FixJ family response regulator
VRPVRIVLDQPQTRVRAVVGEALAGQPDLMIVGETSGEVDLLLSAEQADVVILGSNVDLPCAAERLFDEYPKLGVIALDVEAARGRLYWLGPVVTQLDPVTPAGLAAAIRLATADLPK